MGGFFLVLGLIWEFWWWGGYSLGFVDRVCFFYVVFVYVCMCLFLFFRVCVRFRCGAGRSFVYWSVGLIF